MWLGPPATSAHAYSAMHDHLGANRLRSGGRGQERERRRCIFHRTRQFMAARQQFVVGAARRAPATIWLRRGQLGPLPTPWPAHCAEQGPLQYMVGRTHLSREIATAAALLPNTAQLHWNPEIS